MLAVWRQLVITSERFLRDRGYGLTVGGRLYLWWLLQRGAATIAGEDRANDRDSIGRAQMATEELLAAAIGIDAESGPGLALGLFLGAVSDPSRRRISRSDLKMALNKLCPLWPFCE
jgi:hypothetical protein